METFSFTPSLSSRRGCELAIGFTISCRVCVHFGWFVLTASTVPPEVLSQLYQFLWEKATPAIFSCTLVPVFPSTDFGHTQVCPPSPLSPSLSKQANRPTPETISNEALVRTCAMCVLAQLCSWFWFVVPLEFVVLLGACEVARIPCCPVHWCRWDSQLPIPPCRHCVAVNRYGRTVCSSRAFSFLRCGVLCCSRIQPSHFKHTHTRTHSRAGFCFMLDFHFDHADLRYAFGCSSAGYTAEHARTYCEALATHGATPKSFRPWFIQLVQALRASRGLA